MKPALTASAILLSVILSSTTQAHEVYFTVKESVIDEENRPAPSLVSPTPRGDLTDFEPVEYIVAIFTSDERSPITVQRCSRTRDWARDHSGRIIGTQDSEPDCDSSFQLSPFRMQRRLSNLVPSSTSADLSADAFIEAILRLKPLPGNRIVTIKHGERAELLINDPDAAQIAVLDDVMDELESVQ